jgi:hypothetical protein
MSRAVSSGIAAERRAGPLQNAAACRMSKSPQRQDSVNVLRSNEVHRVKVIFMILAPIHGGPVMTLDWRNSLMLGFIAAVFVTCLFGPYMISVMLGGLGLTCYLTKHARPGA